jgi:hypothetical protein
MRSLGNSYILLGDIRPLPAGLLFRGFPFHHRVGFSNVFSLPIGVSGSFFVRIYYVSFSQLAVHRPDSAVEISVNSQIFSIYYIRWELLSWPPAAPTWAAISCHSPARFIARQLFLATLLLA